MKMDASGWLRGLEKVLGTIPRTGHSAEDYDPPAVNVGSPITGRTTPVALYQIAVTRYDEAEPDKPTGQTIIRCVTSYTLLDDVAEWIQEEIDPRADVTEVPAEQAQEFVRELDPEAWQAPDGASPAWHSDTTEDHEI
jgi:hypothetical protein